MSDFPKNAVFVAGTDTEVGKTYVTTRLISALRQLGKKVAGYKPIECGGRDDSTSLFEAMGETDFSLDEINIYPIREPLAPVSAELSELISFTKICEGFERLLGSHDFVLVEGIGGWKVPLDESRTMEDLVKELGIPVLVVASDKLGVLNHTLLTLDAIDVAGLKCEHLVLNKIPNSFEPDLSQETNAKALRGLRPNLTITEAGTDFSDWEGLAKSITGF